MFYIIYLFYFIYVYISVLNALRRTENVNRTEKMHKMWITIIIKKTLIHQICNKLFKSDRKTTTTFM